MGFVFSDLKLDGDAPVRARPAVGEWGPVEVTATAAKKRGRLLAVLFFILALAVLLAAGFYWFKTIHG